MNETYPQNTYKLCSIEMLMIRLKLIQYYWKLSQKKWVCQVFVYKFASMYMPHKVPLGHKNEGT